VSDLRSAKSQLKQTKAQIEQKKQEIKEGLPHLYQWKWYQWAYNFFKSTNKMNLLVAANQASKSSTQIRKCIEWAGNPKLWPGLWKHRPLQFWYLYPAKDVATLEFNLKWIPQFMPRGAYKEHPTYGWKEVRDRDKNIDQIIFNSGVTVVFKTYAQNVTNLQTGSVDAIFADEEVPAHLYSELAARLIGTKGYYHQVFTATLGEDMWHRAMEGKGEAELFPDAFKQCVSLYECITYMDGTPGAFTEEDVERAKRACKDQNEIDRRIMGRFVKDDGGRKYPSFDGSRHYVQSLPKDFERWIRYAAVDYGSGGTGGHPPAICFVAVRPDYQKGLVYRAWRGDDGLNYTAGDVFNRFLELRGTDRLTMQVYDSASKDFGTIAERAGESFIKADKSHDRGEEFINTLFKCDMMHLLVSDETEKLGGELNHLQKDTPKRKAKDDLADAFRYAVVMVPWDWSAAVAVFDRALEIKVVEARPLTEEERLAYEIRQRRGELEVKDAQGWQELDDEIAYWNDVYGA
jgi:hypothetical protein